MKRTVLVSMLVLAMVLGTVAYAIAATQTITGVDVAGKYTAVGNVTVNASVNPKVILGLSEDVIAAGALDPEAAAPQFSTAVTVDTKSNVLCNLTNTHSGTMGGGVEPTFANDLGAQAGIRGVNSYTDNYTIGVDYDVNPGSFSETVVYTLVQQ